MTTLANYLSTSSKYASREQKKATMDAIVASGVNGITSKELRKVNGLERFDHMRLMRCLSDHGGIRKIGVVYHDHTADIKWSAIW